MTAKDFRLIAQAILETDLRASDKQAIAEQFSEHLARTNPAFKRDLFVQAATGVVPVGARKAKDMTTEELKGYAWSRSEAEAAELAGRLGVQRTELPDDCYGEGR